MTQEDKQLLLKDLCARLPYGVKVQVPEQISINPLRVYGVRQMYKSIWGVGRSKWIATFWNDTFANIKEVKPYLRPMSSMTNNEIETYRIIIKSLLEKSVTDNVATLYNFLNSKHLDYNALIPQGLAIEAPEGMYKND